MARKEQSDGNKKAAPAAGDAVRKPGMVVEGEEAVELYTQQIAFNLTELEKQVDLLREACVRTGKLLRAVE